MLREEAYGKAKKPGSLSPLMTRHGKKRSKEDSPGQRQHETIRQAIRDILSKTSHSFEENYYIGHDVFGDDHSVNFFLKNLAGCPNGLAIEVIVPRKRWKDWAWEVIMGNIKERVPCPVIIVYPEAGIPSERLQFLKKNVDHKQILHVFNLAEFLRFWDSEDRPRRLHSGDRGRSWQNAGGRMK